MHAHASLRCVFFVVTLKAAATSGTRTPSVSFSLSLSPTNPEEGPPAPPLTDAEIGVALALAGEQQQLHRAASQLAAELHARAQQQRAAFLADVQTRRRHRAQGLADSVPQAPPRPGPRFEWELAQERVCAVDPGTLSFFHKDDWDQSVAEQAAYLLDATHVRKQTPKEIARARKRMGALSACGPGGGGTDEGFDDDLSFATSRGDGGGGGAFALGLGFALSSRIPQLESLGPSSTLLNAGSSSRDTTTRGGGSAASGQRASTSASSSSSSSRFPLQTPPHTALNGERRNLSVSSSSDGGFASSSSNSSPRVSSSAAAASSFAQQQQQLRNGANSPRPRTLRTLSAASASSSLRQLSLPPPPHHTLAHAHAHTSRPSSGEQQRSAPSLPTPQSARGSLRI